MAKVKYGIFDSKGRKIVGILGVKDDVLTVEVNGEVIDLVEKLKDYNDCDIFISIEERSEELV